MVDNPVDNKDALMGRSEPSAAVPSRYGHPLEALGGGVSFYVSGEKGAGYEATARFWQYWPLDITLFAKGHTEQQLFAALVKTFRGQRERFAKLDAAEAEAQAVLRSHAMG